jgi:hypothetical protein
MEGLKREAQRRLLYQYRLSEVGRQNFKKITRGGQFGEHWR